MRAVVVRASGEIEEVDTPEPGPGRLEAIKAVVGGWIEAVAAPGGHVMYLNEEGKLLGLSPNYAASALASAAMPGFNDIIVGDVLLVGPIDENGDDTAATIELEFLDEGEALP